MLGCLNYSYTLAHVPSAHWSDAIEKGDELSCGFDGAVWVQAGRFPSSCLLLVLWSLLYYMAKSNLYQITSDYLLLTLEGS